MTSYEKADKSVKFFVLKKLLHLCGVSSIQDYSTKIFNTTLKSNPNFVNQYNSVLSEYISGKSIATVEAGVKLIKELLDDCNIPYITSRNSKSCYLQLTADDITVSVPEFNYKIVGNLAFRFNDKICNHWSALMLNCTHDSDYSNTWQYLIPKSVNNNKIIISNCVAGDEGNKMDFIEELAVIIPKSCQSYITSVKLRSVAENELDYRLHKRTDLEDNEVMLIYRIARDLISTQSLDITIDYDSSLENSTTHITLLSRSIYFNHHLRINKKTNRRRLVSEILTQCGVVIINKYTILSLNSYIQELYFDQLPHSVKIIMNGHFMEYDSILIKLIRQSEEQNKRYALTIPFYCKNINGHMCVFNPMQIDNLQIEAFDKDNNPITCFAQCAIFGVKKHNDIIKSVCPDSIIVDQSGLFADNYSEIICVADISDDLISIESLNLNILNIQEVGTYKIYHLCAATNRVYLKSTDHFVFAYRKQQTPISVVVPRLPRRICDPPSPHYSVTQIEMSAATTTSPQRRQ